MCALRLAAGVRVVDGDIIASGNASNVDPQLDLESLPGELLPSLACDLFVGDAQEHWERFEDRHVRSQPTPHAAHFESDHSRSDNAQALGHVWNRQSPFVVENTLVVEGRSAKRAGPGASRDDHVFRLQLCGARSRYLDLPCARRSTGKASCFS